MAAGDAKYMLVPVVGGKVKMKIIENADGSYSQTSDPTPGDNVTPLPVRETPVNAGVTLLNGIAGAPFTSADQHTAAAAVITAPATGKKATIVSVFVSVDTACLVTLTGETDNNVIAKIHMPVGSYTWKPTIQPQLLTAVKRLMVQTDIAAAIAVDATYFTS